MPNLTTLLLGPTFCRKTSGAQFAKNQKVILVFVDENEVSDENKDDLPRSARYIIFLHR